MGFLHIGKSAYFGYKTGIKFPVCKMHFPPPLKTLIRDLLKPAVRLALRRGIKIQALVSEIKTVLLEEAAREIASLRDTPTTSKLSVMTGIQRRDIKRIDELHRGEHGAPHLDLITRIIGSWTQGASFSNGGDPRPLTYNGGEGDFSDLVRSISQDLNPSTVLFELERLALVERDGEFIKLKVNSYQITGDLDDAYSLVSSDIRNLIESVERNITDGAQIPNLHITTSFDNVAADDLDRIREWLLKKGAALHAEARQYISLCDKDLNPSRYADKGGGKVWLTSFSLCEEPERASDAAPIKRRAKDAS
jgi:hypothetical protein